MFHCLRDSFPKDLSDGFVAGFRVAKLAMEELEMALANVSLGFSDLSLSLWRWRRGQEEVLITEGGVFFPSLSRLSISVWRAVLTTSPLE